MNPLPPDWKEDEVLWKALGRVPRARPPSNFVARVQERRDQEARELSRSSLHRTSVFVRDWLTLPRSTPRWVVAVAAAVACFTIGLFIQPAGGTASAVRGELEILARNLDLIQNLDVIEHLDEL
jgi:hypothetical protein